MQAKPLSRRAGWRQWTVNGYSQYSTARRLRFWGHRMTISKYSGSMSAPVERVLDKLANVKKHQRTDGTVYWTANCPVHDDRHASLSIAEGRDGRAVIKCHAGCTADQITGRIGLSLADLFEKKDAPRRVSRKQGEGGALTPAAHDQHCNAKQEANNLGCTLADYALLKRLSVDSLRSYGLNDMSYLRTPAIRFPYMDQHGQIVATRYRTALTKSEDGTDNRFKWKGGDKPCLYGLWRLDAAHKAGYVVLLEGESDCHTLWHHGIPALGLPGAANWNEARDASHFDGIPIIYVVIEPDTGGKAVRKWLATSLIRERVLLITLGEHKDPSALHIADSEHFRERLQAAMDAAEAWTDIAAREADESEREAWEACKDLATKADILAEVEAALQHSGLVGEARAVKLLYLTVVSRFLDRPVSIAVKGPSSGGKSYAVERVLALFPPDAFYALSAMSERALAYSDEPLQHRILVIFEAAGMAGDFASYLMRSLLSEGCVRYETVEKTKDGLKARLIEREGPTGLIVTTTAVHLHPENETRLISLPVTDTQDQTAAVMGALAEGADAEGAGAAVDYAPWHALQTWLAIKERRVVIPYAKTLAGAIPPVAVRLRRDFGALLNLIRAHAMLHQTTREKDTQGRIVATVDDYDAVRELIADLVAEGVEATVSATMRETVTAVLASLRGVADATVSVTAVARHMKLDRSAVSRRINAAIDRGYLKNLEEKRGQPARICLGDALPEDADVLPSADSLRKALLCSGAGVSEGIPSPLPPETSDAQRARTISRPITDRDLPHIFGYREAATHD